MDRIPLTAHQTDAALEGLPDWRSRLGALHTAYRAGSVAAALDLIAGIGAAAEELDHHPDVDWRYQLVFVRTSTHSAGRAVTAYDVELAARITTLARAAGASAVPELSRTVEIGIDTAEPDGIRDVWAGALGYQQTAEGQLVDPHGRGPAVWFQVSGTPAVNRLHLDVHVAAESAGQVIDAAVQAGGRSEDQDAPAFTVLTDADGNRLCICTPLGREDSPS